MNSPPDMLLVLGLYMEVNLYFLNVCPFDCTTIAGSGKVEPINLRLTKPVG